MTSLVPHIPLGIIVFCGGMSVIAGVHTALINWTYINKDWWFPVWISSVIWPLRIPIFLYKKWRGYYGIRVNLIQNGNWSIYVKVMETPETE